MLHHCFCLVGYRSYLIQLDCLEGMMEVLAFGLCLPYQHPVVQLIGGLLSSLARINNFDPILVFRDFESKNVLAAEYYCLFDGVVVDSLSLKMYVMSNFYPGHSTRIICTHS